MKISAESHRAIEQLLRCVAGLTDDRPAPGAFDDPIVADHLVTRASIEGLSGFLANAVERGEVDVTDRVRESAIAIHRAAMIHVLHVDRTAIRCVELLAAAGIRCLVVKGVALANLVYADPSIRCYGDADLLIEPHQISNAVRLLVRRGGDRIEPEVRPGYDERFAKDVEVRMWGESVDLHRTLVDGPFGFRLPIHRLFDEPIDVDIGDASLPVPSITDMYLHAAMTVGIGDVPPRLVTVRDLLEIEGDSRFDADEAVLRAATLAVEMPVARAMAVRREVAPDRPSPLDAWARSFRWRPSDRLTAWAYTNASRTYWRKLVAFPAIGGWRDRGAYLRALLAPSAQFAHSRGTTRGRFISRGAARVLSARSRRSGHRA